MNKLTTLVCMAIMLLSSSVVMAGSQQEKMKSCNKEAKLKMLKGDARKSFMKKCLSGKNTSPGDSPAPGTVSESKQGQKNGAAPP